MAGCAAIQGHYAPPEPLTGESVHVFIDPRFTAAQRAAIEQAFAQWNWTLNGYYRFSVRPDGAPGGLWDAVAVLIARADDARRPKNAIAWVPALGVPRIYVVDEELPGRDLRLILVHEIGHVLGAAHSSDDDSVMWPYYPFGAWCVDGETAGRLARANGWSVEKMRWGCP